MSRVIVSIALRPRCADSTRFVVRVCMFVAAATAPYAAKITTMAALMPTSTSTRVMPSSPRAARVASLRSRCFISSCSRFRC